MAHLPIEIIWRFAPPWPDSSWQHLLNCSLVCRQWHAAVTGVIYTRIQVNHARALRTPLHAFALSPSRLNSVSQYCLGNAKHASLYSASHDDAEQFLLRLAHCGAKLKSLELLNCGMDDHVVSAMKLLGADTVHDLNLDVSSVADPRSVILSFCLLFKNLTHLTISSYNELEPATLAAVILSNPNIQHIVFDVDNMKSEVLVSLTEPLSLVSLKLLGVGDPVTVPSDFSDIAKLHSNSLRYLGLNFPVDDGDSVAEFLQRLPHLKELTLLSFGTAQLSNMEHPPSVRALNLRRTHLSSVSQWTRQFYTHLRVLILGPSSPGHIQVPVDAIKSCRNLEVLDARQLAIDESAAEDLCVNNSKIISLDLGLPANSLVLGALTSGLSNLNKLSLGIFRQTEHTFRYNSNDMAFLIDSACKVRCLEIPKLTLDEALVREWESGTYKNKLQPLGVGDGWDPEFSVTRWMEWYEF